MRGSEAERVGLGGSIAIPERTVDIMSTSDSPFVIWVVLNLPRKHQPLLDWAAGVHLALTNNNYFTHPDPPLGVFGDHIDAYRKSMLRVKARNGGAVAQRASDRLVVVQDLHHIRDYIQGIVETETNPAVASKMVESAGMRLRLPRKSTKEALIAENAATAGSVWLVARAVARIATYYWEYSLNQQDWSRAPDTLQAKTVISGLASARTYYFRFRALTRDGETAYSQVVSLVVH